MPLFACWLRRRRLVGIQLLQDLGTRYSLNVPAWGCGLVVCVWVWAAVG